MLSESAIQKKRQFTVERAERLRDPRQRVLGIDKAALDEQVREKEAMKKMEKERSEFFDTQALMMDKHAQVLQREVDDVRIQREREVQKYRDTFQTKQNRREWDLNNPKRVVGDLPARVSDDDPRCGPASMQHFEGEDLDSKHRRMAQAEQQRRWAQQQVDERLMRNWQEREDNRKYEDRAEETAYRAYEVERKIADQRNEIAKATAEFNKQLAEQKRREQLQERMNQTKRNLEEIDNAVNSDFLCEGDALSTLNGRPRVDGFKGLTNEQRAKIAQTQAMQLEELRQRRLREAEEERQWAQHEMMDNRMALALDRQRDRERRNAAKELGRERAKQAEEAAKKKKEMDELFRNEIGEEFFKFGKCLD